MDYEKEYVHAFEIAKGYWGGATDFVRGILESMFPQLADSEDERIRKVLIHIVKAACNKYGIKYRGDEIGQEKLLAYLEKQKENKPELCDMGRWDEESFNNGIHRVLQNPEAYGLTKQKPAEWSEEDESILRLIHEALSCAYSVKNMDAQTCSVMREWLNNRVKSLRPQPHWKPSEEQMGALNYAYCELFKRQDVGHNILGPLQNLIDTLSKL